MVTEPVAASAAPQVTTPVARTAGPTDISEAVGAHVETTLYGDLPEGFWGERATDTIGVAPRPGAIVDAHPSDAQLGERVATDGFGPDEPPGAVQLFMPASAGVDAPPPRGYPRTGEPPPEPEGERFEQLQALFPGRIIEVARRDSAATDDQEAAADARGAPTSEYEGSDTYTNAPGTESTDEPRYDTAAEAAAEESR